MVGTYTKEVVQAYFQGGNAVGKSSLEIEDALYIIKNFIEEKSSRTPRPSDEK